MKEIRERVNTATVGLETLLTEAERIKAESKDFIVETPVYDDNIRFTKDGTLWFRPDGAKRKGKELPLSPFAMKQFCTKITDGRVTVPGDFMQECLEYGDKALVEKTINTWLPRKKKGGFLFRQTEDHLRAALSPRYSIYDSERILDVIDKKVDLSGYKIKGSFINEERLHVRFISEEMMQIEGEDLFPAIFLDSSDVGRNTLIVTFGIYKMVCTNGLVIGRADGILFKQRHIGIDPEEFEYGIAAGLDNIPILTKNAQLWVEKARTEAMKIDDVIKELEKLSLKKETDNVIYLMDNRYGRSKWGYINAITEVAQKYTLEKREELETVAGKILVAA